MKKDIHPSYKPLKVLIGSDEFHLMSCYGKPTYVMDIDFRKHRAWTGEGVNVANSSNKSVVDFNRKFAGISFGMKK